MIDKMKTALSIIKFSKKIVLFCLSFVTIYTVIAIVFQIVTCTELSPTLTERVFTCLVGELCLTAMLKVAEVVVNAILIYKDKDVTETHSEAVVENISDVDLTGEGLGDDSDLYGIDKILADMRAINLEDEAGG